MTDNDDDTTRDRTPRSPDSPRDVKPRGDKPFRSRDGGDRPFKPRGDKPFRAREDGDRSFKPRGDRPFTPRGDRPAGDRPFRSREDGDRAFKPRGDRPFTPRGNRPAGDRPFRAREDGDRAFKPRGDRPFTPRGDRPFRGREDGDRAFKPREDRDRYIRRDEEPAERPEVGSDRIAKVMARAGLCSRRDAEGWIEQGRVSVNGEVLTSPALDVTTNDVILVDGKPLPQRERTRLWLYHKPKGLVTTEHDPEGRPTVFDNLPDDLPRVMSVGRLDINTEGLLLLTNDGGLARVLAHPKTAWLRRYRVRVHGEVDQAMLNTLNEGVTIEDDEDGEMTYGPIVATLERSRGANSWLTMDLREGKNREIKRVLEHLGLQVTRLIRVSFGPFQLGELEEAEVEEIRSRYLRDQLGDRLAEEAGVDFDSPVFRREGQPPAQEPSRTRSAPQDREGRARTVYSEEEPPKRRYDSKKPGEKRDSALLGNRPDLKVEREKVADRKGRPVKVERVVTLPREDEDSPRSRYDSAALADPNRRFGRPGADGERKPFRPREDGDRSFKPRGDRPFTPRGDRPDSDRKPFRPREDGDRSFKPRGDRPFTPRGDRPDGDRKPFRPREDGDRAFKPRGDRPFTPRGDRPDGDRKPFRPREDGDRSFKPRGDRPFTPRGDRPDGDRKPFRPREDGDRAFKPRGDRPFTPRGDRPDGDRKPFRPREDGDRAFKPRGDRPFTPRGDRPDGDRKPFRPREDGDRAFKPRGDRPFTPRGDRPDGGGRPPFKPRSGPGGRPGGGFGGPKRPGGGKGADRRR